MTLTKLLLIFISTLFSAIYSVSYVININSIKDCLQAESEIRAQETATLLAQSLSPYILNQSDPILKTKVQTIFDTGYYQEIKLDSINDKTLVKLTHDNAVEEVPIWFINFFPIEPATADSDISSGWKFGGTIYVTINPGYAYLKLYQQAKNTIYYSLIAFLFLIGLSTFLLRLVLKPLKDINKLALALTESNFVTIEQLPWATTEVTDLANSLSIIAHKLSDVVKNLHENLSSFGQKLQLDNLTGIYNKNTFDCDLKQLYLEPIDGYLFLIKTDSLATLVKERGSEAIDLFLQKCAAQIKLTTQNFSCEATAYHFHGAEFAVLARNIQLPLAQKLAKALSATLAELGHINHDDDIGHIGVVEVNLLGNPADVLTAAHEAYEQAAIIGPNSYFIRASNDRVKDIAEWRALIFDIVERNSYNIQFINPIHNLVDNRILMNEVFIQTFDKDGTPLPTGLFVSIAEKFEKIVALEQGVIEKVIDHLKSTSPSLNIAINLSTRTIKNGAFRSWFANQLKLNTSIIPQLIITVSAYSVVKDCNAYYEFVTFLRSLGVRMMLKRFDSQSMPLNTLQILKPDFIRLSRELSNGLQGDFEKLNFLQTVKQIGDLLDISILAENIHSNIDFDIIRKIGFAGASRCETNDLFECLFNVNYLGLESKNSSN